MKGNRTTVPVGKRPALTAMTSTKLALLTLGAKKAAELWQSRRQPPPPPSLRQRLGGPAKVALAAAGVGGAAYFAARSGVVTQVKEKLGRSSGNGPEQVTSFGASAPEMEADPVVERPATEPPPRVVNTEPASSLAPDPPPSMP
jgi:hypothetical protein